MREISCEEVKLRRKEWMLLDVRTPEEFNGQLGHIEGAKLMPLGDELLEFLKSIDINKKIVFVCRTGVRSGQLTMLSEEMGMTQTFNMAGGMLRWNELSLPTAREAEL